MIHFVEDLDVNLEDFAEVRTSQVYGVLVGKERSEGQNGFVTDH